MDIAFKQARNYRAGRREPIRLIVIHDMEAPENATTAESVAAYFAGANAPMASTHYNVDNNSIVQSVREGDVAFCAPGANEDGIHIEQAGYARQTRAQWLDPYSTAMLKLSAQLVGELCSKYSIPVRRLTDAQLRDGVTKGIVGHADVSRVFKQSTHTDPGPNFPWDQYLAWVKQSQGDDMPLTAADAKLVVDALMARAVVTGKTVANALNEAQYANDAYTQAVAVRTEATTRYNLLKAQVDALAAALKAAQTDLTAVKVQLAKPAAPPVDIEALAANVAGRIGPAIGATIEQAIAEGIRKRLET